MELKYKNHLVEKIIDASGRSVLPGLVDAHTHPVWAGDRVHEFSMKVLTNLDDFESLIFILLLLLQQSAN